MTQPNKQRKENETEKNQKKKSELKNNDLTNQNPSKKTATCYCCYFSKKDTLLC